MFTECDCDDCCFQTRIGPQGDQGPESNGRDGVGPQGDQGYQSHTEFLQGMQGYQGPPANGLIGIDGPQGAVGRSLRGSQGDPGYQGDAIRGNQGFDGDVGSQGYTGSTERGPQGSYGQDGRQGAIGRQGRASNRGAQGNKGIQGVNGAWLNYMYGFIDVQGPFFGSSPTIATYTCPPVDSFFTFSCMAYAPRGTVGTIDIWQDTHVPANTLSSQPWSFPMNYSTSDRLPYSVNVPISLFTNSSPIVVGFYSNPPGTFMSLDMSTATFVQNATVLH